MKLRRERLGLALGPRHHDSFAKQRQASVPVELLVQPYHLAQDDGGGWLQSVNFDQPGKRREGSGHGFLVRARAPAHGDRGCIGRAAARHQLTRDVTESGEPHENDQGLGLPYAVPVDGADVVSGDEGHNRGMFAVRERNAAVSSDSAASPPRPKMNGSPPLSRTTVNPRRARSMSIAQISS